MLIDTGLGRGPTHLDFFSSDFSNSSLDPSSSARLVHLPGWPFRLTERADDVDLAGLNLEPTWPELLCGQLNLNTNSLVLRARIYIVVA